jgi:hypothetical protein
MADEPEDSQMVDTQEFWKRRAREAIEENNKLYDEYYGASGPKSEIAALIETRALPPISVALRSRIIDGVERADILNAVVEYAAECVQAETQGLSPRTVRAFAVLATHYDELPDDAQRDAIERLFQMARSDLMPMAAPSPVQQGEVK